MDIIEQVRQNAAKKILILPHAGKQMLRPDRMITTQEVRQVVEYDELLEDYADDARGHSSCLLPGYGSRIRPIHMVRSV